MIRRALAIPGIASLLALAVQGMPAPVGGRQGEGGYIPPPKAKGKAQLRKRRRARKARRARGRGRG